ncbi:amidohydrolase [Chthonobacter albigriseus]|uniref:amidohydrolase n=1 Tax=Chthonobacter albigriseus TaxID=1683161 RepID=UPI0015EF5767
MPVSNSIRAAAPEIAEWRRDFHRNPELLYDVHRTASVVAEKLRAFGLDRVETGIGRTGVVGVLHGRAGAGTRTVALRADMDALPIHEITGKPWSSAVPGKMHACGHDGHTAMLLGAARQLAETRAFEGTIVFIFQPAEEGGGGARTMLEDGLLDRFPFDEVYGLHNMPGLDVGRFAIRPGPIMAAADVFRIDLEGRGGHAAKPHATIDPVLVGSHIVTALQSIVSRTVDPLSAAVVSVTEFHAGDTSNVIPQTAWLGGTVRTLDAGVRSFIEERLRHIVASTAAVFGATAEVGYRRGYPVTVNDPRAARFAADVARKVVGDAAVSETADPMMGAEDFAYFLERRPGAYIFMGNGPSAGLHHPAYDFDDEAIAYGSSWWVALAEEALAR